MTKLGFLLTGSVSVCFALLLIYNSIALESKNKKRQALGIALSIVNAIFVANALYRIL
ncbi:hypothetical protein [Clostridium senegalense]